MDIKVEVPTQTLWQPGIEELYFRLAGRELKRVRLRALTLTTPFTRLSTNLEDSAPRWQDFPTGFVFAVVPGQPVGVTPPRRLIKRDKLIRYVYMIAPRYFVNLEGTFEDYLRKFTAKQRHNLTREIRKFAEYSGGRIEWREFSTPEEMMTFHDLAIEIGRHSWHGDLGTEAFPSSEEFKGEMMDLAIQGRLRGYVLFHAARPITFTYCRDQYENLCYSRIGYDSRYAKWSPGKILLYLLLERLFAEKKYQYLDFCDGVMHYKVFFATGSRLCAHVLYAKPTLRNLLLLGGHASLTAFSVGMGWFLQRLRLKGRIKKLLTAGRIRPGAGLPEGHGE